MNKSGNTEKEEESGSKEQIQATSHSQDAPKIRDSAEVEKTQHHDTETEVDDASLTGSMSSIWEEERQQSSRPVSRSLSRHISESEIRDGFQNQRDPELGPELTDKVDTTAPNPNDPNLVTWTGPDDPDNPKNWAFSKKWAAVFTVSLFTLISPISSSLVAPALDTIADELGIDQACKSMSHSPPRVPMRSARAKFCGKTSQG